jgi:RHS repeat-associated protein
MLTAVSGRYGNTVTYTYDTAGRKSTEALTISGQTYTVSTAYDAAGQVSGYTYPDGKVVGRTYSDRGQLATLVYDGTTIDTRAYDDGGRMTSSSYHNGVSESRTYNNDNTLAGISFTGAAIGNLTYGWDENKNKTSESIGGTMSGYGFGVGGSGYDSEDRLVNWQRADAALDQAWNLSLVGDWNSITENATTQNRTHGPTHELVSVASQSVTHDAKGNMTLIPALLRGSSQTPNQPLKMKWDFENKLLAADIDNGSTDDVFYKFDALGRRVARHSVAAAQNTVYFQSGQQTIADYTAGTTASSPTYTYVYASYIDEPVVRASSGGSVNHYFHRNQQYSITALTDASGAIVERYAYTAYGTPTITDASGITRTTTAIGNRYSYTGREWDETLALYQYRARKYDSAGGRFCSRDPIRYVDSLSQYISRMSTIGADPSGMISVELKHELNVAGCSGCGGIDQNVSISVGQVPGAVDGIRAAPYYLVQELCVKQSGRYCHSACGEDCEINDSRPAPKMDCCHVEVVGRVDIVGKKAILFQLGHNGKEARQVSSIPDNWSFDSLGESSCHSTGTMSKWSRLILIEQSQELENIEKNYIPQDNACGDRTIKMGPGLPQAKLVGKIVGKSAFFTKTDWNCCPLQNRKNACGPAENKTVPESAGVE